MVGGDVYTCSMQECIDVDEVSGEWFGSLARFERAAATSVCMEASTYSLSESASIILSDGTKAMASDCYERGKAVVKRERRERDDDERSCFIFQTPRQLSATTFKA